MDELSEAAHRLMDVAQTEDEPPEAQVEGSWGMVVSRVQSERDADPDPGQRGRSIMAWAAIGGGVIVLAALGIRLAIVTPPAAEADTYSARPPLSSREVAQAPTMQGARADAASDPDPTRMLDDAEAALAGDPAQALELLVRHAEVASDEAEVPRRLALRIRSLCALGRVEDARHETAAFFERHADTPPATAVRAACGMRDAGH